MVVSTNTQFVGNTSNAVIGVTSNSLYGDGRVTVKGSFADIQSTNTFVNGTLLQVKSNVHINSTSSNVSINSTALHVTGTTFDINSTTVDMDGTTLTVDYDDITLTANDITLKADGSTTVLDINYDGTTLDSTISGNTFTIDADESVFNANVTLGSATTDTVSVVSVVDTNVNPDANGVNANTRTLGATDARWNLNSNTVTVSNTLTVTGNAVFNSDVDLGNANSDIISIAGEVDTNINPTANAKSLGANDNRWHLNSVNIDASGSLDVTGATTLGNTISATGAATLSNTLAVTGAATLSNTLGVTGATTLSNTVGVTGAATLANTISVTGSALLSNTANVGGLLRAKAGLITTGTANATSGMNVGANVLSLIHI